MTRADGLPPGIATMVDQLLDDARAIAGNGTRQFALLLTSIGVWADGQSDPGKWLAMAIDTLTKHAAIEARTS